MSRQNDLATISVDDVVQTLWEFKQDFRYKGKVDHYLTFASELAGLSKDTLAEMMAEKMHAELDKNSTFQPMIYSQVDSAAGTRYTVQVGVERYVDVMAHKNGAIMWAWTPWGHGAPVYSTYDLKGSPLGKAFYFDYVSVMNLVLKHIKKQAGLSLDAVLDGARERSAASGGDDSGKDRYIEKE